MDGKLRNMTGLYLQQGDQLLLLYRLGSKVISDSYTASAGGHFEKEELNDAKEITSNEGNLKWFQIEEVLKNPPEMPFSARYVVKHYAEIGKNTDVLYAGVATKDGVVFTEMEEF